MGPDRQDAARLIEKTTDAQATRGQTAQTEKRMAQQKQPDPWQQPSESLHEEGDRYQCSDQGKIPLGP